MPRQAQHPLAAHPSVLWPYFPLTRHAWFSIMQAPTYHIEACHPKITWKADRGKQISIQNHLFIAWSTKPSKRLWASDSHSTPLVGAKLGPLAPLQAASETSLIAWPSGCIDITDRESHGRGGEAGNKYHIFNWANIPLLEGDSDPIMVVLVELSIKEDLSAF